MLRGNSKDILKRVFADFNRHYLFFRKKDNAGFTLFELIVGVTIFGVVVSGASTAFILALKTQRNVVATQNVIDNTRFALENISRQIRMAQRDDNGNCTGVTNYTFSQLTTADISFINFEGDCATYKMIGGAIFIDIDEDDGAGGFYNPVGDVDIPLTSNDITIDNLEFDIFGEDAYDAEQPRVVIIVEASAGAGASTSGIDLQTTVSVRNIDTP